MGGGNQDLASAKRKASNDNDQNSAKRQKLTDMSSYEMKELEQIISEATAAMITKMAEKKEKWEAEKKKEMDSIGGGSGQEGGKAATPSFFCEHLRSGSERHN